MLTIRKMEIMVSIAEEKSITNAAAKRFMTQPAVTKILNDVLREYSMTIFQRIDRKWEMTPEGSVLINEMRNILHEYYAFENKYKLHKVKKQIHVGLCNTLLKSTIIDIINTLNTQMPDCDFSFYHHNSRYVDRSFEKGELNISVSEFKPLIINQFAVSAGDNTHIIAYNSNLKNIVEKYDSVPELIRSQPFSVCTHGTLGRWLFDTHSIRTSALTSSPFFASSNMEYLVECAKENNSFLLIPKRWVRLEIASGNMEYFEPFLFGFHEKFYISIDSNNEAMQKELSCAQRIIIKILSHSN